MFCYVHIERGAGTTLHYIFRNNFLSYIAMTPSFSSVAPHMQWTNRPENVFSAREAHRLFRLLPWSKGFGGHTVRSYAGYETALGREIDHITFLREPVSRYLSHFSHKKRNSKGWTLERFMNNSEFDNFMTVKIAGEPDVKKAQQILADDYSFVGLVEEFNKSLLLMAHAVPFENFDPRHETKNADPDKKSSLNIQPALLSELRERNLLDTELYRWVSNELFPSYAADYPGDIDSDAAALEDKNKGFRFSCTRKLFWRLYRYLGYRNIEFFLQLLYHRNGVVL